MADSGGSEEEPPTQPEDMAISPSNAPASVGDGVLAVRDRTRSPRRFSHGAYQEEVFELFGRASVDSFANRFAHVQENHEESDSGVSFRDQIAADHTAVQALVTQYPTLFGKRYDELVLLKTAVDHFTRRGARSHDLFLVRLFATIFGGPICPWKCHFQVAFRYEDGAFSPVSSVNVQQALRIEAAVSDADGTLLRMSKDKDVFFPRWDGEWLRRDAAPAGADRSNEEPKESFKVCRQMLATSLSKLIQNGGQYVLRNFVNWCGEPKRPAAVLSFRDCSIVFNPGGQATKIVKSPNNNCYTYVPMSIKYQPSPEDIDRYVLFVGTLYGTDIDARELEAAGKALALMSKRQPPRCRVRKGRGGNGKSLRSNLTRAALQETNVKFASTYLLTRDREFQVSAKRLIGAFGIIFQEFKKGTFIDDVVAKNLFGRAELLVRENHGKAADEQMYAWVTTDFVIELNHAFRVDENEETLDSWRRRLLVIACEGDFTRDTSLVSPAAGVFLADPELEAWVSSGVAGFIHLTRSIIPLIETTSEAELYRRLNEPSPDRLRLNEDFLREGRDQIELDVEGGGYDADDDDPENDGGGKDKVVDTAHRLASSILDSGADMTDSSGNFRKASSLHQGTREDK